MTPMLKVDEVAKALRVSVTTVYRLVELGRLESVRVGHQIRIPASVLDTLSKTKRSEKAF